MSSQVVLHIRFPALNDKHFMNTFLLFNVNFHIEGKGERIDLE